MKKKTTIIILLVMMFVLFAVAGTIMFYLNYENTHNNPKNKTLNEVGLQTFADMTEVEEFQTIPLYDAEGIKITEPIDRGDNVYMVTVNGTDKNQYEAYLKTLKDAGYKLFADNGAEGIDQTVFTASFTKETLTVTVTYVGNEETVYITSSEKMELSPHLIDKEEYRSNLIDGMSNTLHMLELYDYGNSFLIQLKNGHFIVNDGGSSNDIKYLIDYIESLLPNGDKPVIEAWIITHAHGDHNGALASLTSDTTLLSRIYIDGIYISTPSDNELNAVNAMTLKSGMMMIQSLPSFAKASDGTNTKVYRPQMGQRYYFCDVVVDIMHTQEQLVREDYANMDINDSSTWTMFHIDGQRFLHSGDADKGSMGIVLRTYSKEYLNLDIYASFHHNLNNWFPFLEYCTIKTTLFTSSTTEAQNKNAGELNSVGSNAWLKENSLEYYSWEDGGKVLTFPYKVGTAKTLPMQEWKYHESRERSEFLKN
jgi:beta-lactamase superfamily II metal-dependent hydrolase